MAAGHDKNKPLTLVLSNPSSQASPLPNQLGNMLKNVRLAHFKDAYIGNKIIDEQNDFLEDLWEDREAHIKDKEALIEENEALIKEKETFLALVNVKPQQSIPLETQKNQSHERLYRFKTKITNAGFKRRRLFTENQRGGEISRRSKRHNHLCG